jgi:hypothetical protein
MNGFGILFEFGKFVDSLGWSFFFNKIRENKSHATLSSASPSQIHLLDVKKKDSLLDLNPNL